MLDIPGQEQPCPLPTSARLTRALIIGVGNLSLPVADGLQVLTASGLPRVRRQRSIWYAVGDALTATPAVYQYNSKFNNLVGVAPRARHAADPRQVGIYFIIPAMHGPEYIL